MQFAPKRPSRRQPKAEDQDVAAAARQDEAGPSERQGDDDDPFAALMEQAAAVVKAEHHTHGHRKNSKFNVAFGGGQEGACTLNKVPENSSNCAGQWWMQLASRFFRSAFLSDSST